ncbi:complement factor H-like isoform X4 [Tachysurus fulvidraco]|uniref:complement factor H-like isoform X4 n=1 Tax=Tachysurus fulvidraco TaxID=1234273 RepID=UPI001FED8811|nr:complement factor H-like isoform X4 [Tachysurus fulvidraco]
MGSNMQVAAKIFFTAFWLSFLSLAKNQECFKEKIDYENVQISDLLESYENGQTVKVKCATGYVGLLRIECKNGKWIKIAGRDCKKRACGHPGDTPNGFFQLTKETEFVFGATVEYSCRTGYTMASRISYRNCRTNGWDNDVPVCEVMKCPILSDFGDVIASGNTEEASYGDVIYFECALNKMLAGPENIHCTENGEWSNTIPKCKEIECLSPEIPHGISNRDKVYKENNVLQYTCTQGYKANNPSKCTRNGWTVQPGCEEISCEYPDDQQLSFPEPFNRGVYKFDQILKYDCKEGYHKTADNAKCTENGWDPKRLCIETTCRKPEVPHGRASTYTDSFKYNDYLQIRCDNGYEPKHFFVKCSKNGLWDGMKDCKLEKRACAETSVQNGIIQEIDTGRKYSYSCDKGYKAFDEKWWDVVSCTEDQWSYAPLCIPNDHCGQIPNGPAKHNHAKKGYKDGTQVVGCDSNTCFFICVEGKWEKKNDQSNKCGSPPPVENAIIASYNWDHVIYLCREKYSIKGGDLKYCMDSQWEKPPTCESPSPLNNDTEARPFMDQTRLPENVPSEQTKLKFNEPGKCSPPSQQIKYATVKSDLKDFYEEGDTVEYQCKEGFHSDSKAECSKGEWRYPKCIEIELA